MKILSIIIIGLLLSNCNNSYVKNKKAITSPDDLQKFVNVYCDKNKSTDKVIKVCGNGWSKDLNISENKAILSAKIKLIKVKSQVIEKKTENLMTVRSISQYSVLPIGSRTSLRRSPPEAASGQQTTNL